MPRLLIALLVTLGTAAPAQPPAPEPLGPVLGDVGPGSVAVWFRPGTPGPVRLVARPVDGEGPLHEATATATGDRRTVVLRLEGLQAATRYRYALHRGEAAVPPGEGSFRTAPDPTRPSVVRLAFGSCADDRAHPRQPVWSAIGAAGAEALVLLGDTPYIDSTDLEVQRRRHRAFLAHPDLAPLLRTTPLYSTWDDHDFGRNDADGRLPGKAASRRAFLEHRLNPGYGEHDQGLYTSFRRGPVEVFLLDTRWFAHTGPSPVDPERPTLLGAAQWRWLRRSLRASTAPFKVLASSIVWNRAVRPFKTDHWAAYPHERDALFRFLGEASITGVVLVSGDVHRTRVIRHDTQDLVGYPLTELVTSPLAAVPIPLSAMPHPGLLFDAALSRTFLLLTADGERRVMEARIVDGTGMDRHAIEFPAEALHR